MTKRNIGDKPNEMEQSIIRKKIRNKPILQHNHFIPVGWVNVSSDKIFNHCQYFHEKIVHINWCLKLIYVVVIVALRHLPQNRRHDRNSTVLLAKTCLRQVK